MAYEIEGRLLEVCTCNVLCPCWVGEDPDYKTCDTAIAWGIEKGSIEGVNVDGLTMAVSAHIPKNILIPKSWKAVVFVDERATAEQEGVLLKLFTGQLGGAIADLAGLIGEVVAVERAPISFTVDGGKGKLKIGTRRRGRDGAVHRGDRQPDHAGRDGLQHDPGLARVRQQGQPVHEGRQRRTASRASTSRTTTPSRATSASPPDRRPDGRDRCSLPLTCASRGRDRAILVGIARRDRGRGLARAVALGRLAATGTTCTTTATAGPLAARGRALHGRLDPDDRRDDAAEQRAAGRDLRGARAAAAAQPGRLVALLLVGYLAGLGRRSGSWPGSPIGSSMPRSRPCPGSPSIRS